MDGIVVLTTETMQQVEGMEGLSDRLAEIGQFTGVKLQLVVLHGGMSPCSTVSYSAPI